jgi:hypothetical protein
VFFPQIDGLASSNFNNTGTGENLSVMPESGPLSSATVLRRDLQRTFRSLTVENKFGNQVDTHLNCDVRTKW